MAHSKTCLSVLAHGDYYKPIDQEIKNVKVPHNIRLIKYSNPGYLLMNYSVNYIEENINNNCKIMNPMSYYVGFTNGEIYREDINPQIIEPGNFIKNLRLIFSDDIEGYTMGFKLHHNKNKPEIIDNLYNTTYSLDDFLQFASDYISKNYPDQIVELHQLTCHSGNYLVKGDIDDIDIDDLTQNLTNLTVGNISTYQSRRKELQKDPSIKPLLKNTNLAKLTADMKHIKEPTKIKSSTMTPIKSIKQMKKTSEKPIHVRKTRKRKDTDVSMHKKSVSTSRPTIKRRLK